MLQQRSPASQHWPVAVQHPAIVVYEGSARGHQFATVVGQALAGDEVTDSGTVGSVDVGGEEVVGEEATVEEEDTGVYACQLGSLRWTGTGSLHR